MNCLHRLIIFTRYPQPGQTKTRLIPALGAAGAADLQRQLTEHTLSQVQQLCSLSPLSVEIWFAGTTAEPATGLQCMQTWLGDTWTYRLQQGNDLGERLSHAIQTAFADGIQQVVVIGIDCPDLNTQRLQQAFVALEQADLVLGPATDGGYYLIGLRSQQTLETTNNPGDLFWSFPLFQAIDWGSDQVFQQTVAVASQLGCSIAYLDRLTDIDRPEDLPVWTAAQKKNCPVLSIIIPVLNEASSLGSVLQSLQGSDDASIEILVVDGGSLDSTVEQALQLGITVLRTPPGRALQMNTGAKAASGEILLFLHGDTRLPPHFLALVQQTLAHPNTTAGAFELGIQGHQWGLRWVEWGVKWRSRLLQLPYGDQALFLTAHTFRQIGGFAELPIMEDFELVLRLRQRGTIRIVPASVFTSGRRWQKIGILKTTVINQLVIVAYLLGISPHRIARFYRSALKQAKPPKSQTLPGSARNGDQKGLN